MPTPTFTIPEPPKIPSGEEFYDAVMSEIEPELVSSVIPTLSEKYKNETEEEKQKRCDRYNKAFEDCYKRYALFIADLNQQVHRYQKQAMRSAEEWNRSQELVTLDELMQTAATL